jgi:hypothetical protein
LAFLPDDPILHGPNAARLIWAKQGDLTCVDLMACCCVIDRKANLCDYSWNTSDWPVPGIFANIHLCVSGKKGGKFFPLLGIQQSAVTRFYGANVLNGLQSL